MCYFMKRNRIGVVLGILSIVSTLFIVGIPIGSKVIRIGFLLGMILSIFGLVFVNKDKKTGVFILNIVAFILSLLSLLMSVLNGLVVNA